MKIVKPQLGQVILGYLGENETTQVQFDCKGFAELYGSGTFTVVHKRSTDASGYPIIVEVADEIVKWNVASADVQYSGYGQAQVIYTVGDAIAKTLVFNTLVLDSVGNSATPPPAWQTWVDSVIQAKDDAVEAKEDAVDAKDDAESAKTSAENARDAILNMSATASVGATVGTPSVVVTKTTVSGHENLDFAFSNLKGQTGATGASAGFGTPTASIDANIGTPSITITATGADTAKVFDFAFHNLKGEKGDTGDVAKSDDSSVEFTVGCDSNGFYVTV